MHHTSYSQRGVSNCIAELVFLCCDCVWGIPGLWRNLESSLRVDLEDVWRLINDQCVDQNQFAYRTLRQPVRLVLQNDFCSVGMVHVYGNWE